MDTPLSKKHRAALEPFSRMILAMNDSLNACSRDELTELDRACNAVSTTNCGWSTYKAAEAIRHEVMYRLRAKRKEEEPADG